MNEQLLGNSALLEVPAVSFLSSRRIAPAAVLRCYDWATDMRGAGRCVVGGFHSPLEKDVLHFLLKGTQPVVLVLARSLWRSVPETLRPALDAGRLLIVSPVSAARVSAATALVRNRWILEHSEEHVFGSVDPAGSLAPLVAALDPATVRLLSDACPTSRRTSPPHGPAPRGSDQGRRIKNSARPL